VIRVPIASVLLALACVPAAVAQPPTPVQELGAAKPIAEIEVASDPSGYDAWVDNRYVGRTPLRTSVAAGPNLLILARCRPESLYSPPAVDTLLNLAAGETVRVFLRLGVPVTILSRPFGLRVARDGAVVGRTPLSLRIDSLRGAELSLVTSHGAVPVPTDSLLALGTWMWKGVEDAPPPPDGGRSFLRKIGRYAMPGIAAVSIVTGAAVEKSADRSYDRYLRSADPGDIRRAYDQARVRDAWATALWTVGEASLASSILAWILPDHDSRDRRSPGGGGDR